MASPNPRHHHQAAAAQAGAQPPAPTTPDGRHRPRPLRPSQAQSSSRRPWPTLSGDAAVEAEQRRRLHQVLFDQLQQSPTGRERLHCRNALVCQNLALVHKLASRQSRRSGVAFEDLCSAGYEGLIRAVESFDHRSGNAFSSFAVPHIHGSMMMDQRDRQQPVHTPRRLRELQQRSQRLQEQRRAAGLPPLALEPLAETLGCSLARLEEAGRVQQALQVRSLDQPLPGHDADAEGAWARDLASAPAAACTSSGPDPAEPDDDIQLGWLRQQLQHLATSDRELLEGRWIDGLSWSALGQRLGCSGAHCRRRALELVQHLQAMAHQLQMAIASSAAIAV